MESDTPSSDTHSRKGIMTSSVFAAAALAFAAWVRSVKGLVIFNQGKSSSRFTSDQYLDEFRPSCQRKDQHKHDC